MIEMWVGGPLQVANGRLDQLEDRLSGTQEAGGSNPPTSTLFFGKRLQSFSFKSGVIRNFSFWYDELRLESCGYNANQIPTNRENRRDCNHRQCKPHVQISLSSTIGPVSD